SPATNERSDAFGGSLANRLAFPRRVIRAIRSAVGDAFIVGIRMSMDEDRPGGLALDEALVAVRRYIEDGIDFVSTVRGSIESDASLARAIPSMGTPSAPFLEFTAGIKRALDVPVMHAG
ncbi:oxidoreductase, partial [Streptomyces sp. GSL17-113]